MSSQQILLVEDDEIIAGFIAHTLADRALEITHAADAEAAWALLEQRGAEFGTILLDRQLPGMSGLELLKQIKTKPELSHIPVVLETSADDAENIREGLAAGAYYYLTKPLQPKLLLAVVEAALEQYRQVTEARAAIEERGRALHYLEEGRFRLRTLTEARELAMGLAQGFPDPGRVLMGLQELLVNAVEHGNLGISYAEKTQLVLNGTWTEEVERRLTLPEYRERTVEVALERGGGTVGLTIRDQGEGFAWQRYLQFEPERAFDPHGRGIAMAAMMSFDTLEYQGNGNTVQVTVALPVEG